MFKYVMATLIRKSSAHIKVVQKMLLIQLISNIVALLPEHSLTKKWLYSGPEILSAGWMDPGLVEGSPVQVKVER